MSVPGNTRSSKRPTSKIPAHCWVGQPLLLSLLCQDELREGGGDDTDSVTAVQDSKGKKGLGLND